MKYRNLLKYVDEYRFGEELVRFHHPETGEVIEIEALGNSNGQVVLMGKRQPPPLTKVTPKKRGKQ